MPRWWRAIFLTQLSTTASPFGSICKIQHQIHVHFSSFIVNPKEWEAKQDKQPKISTKWYGIILYVVGEIFAMTMIFCCYCRSSIRKKMWVIKKFFGKRKNWYKSKFIVWWGSENYNVCVTTTCSRYAKEKFSLQ
jgi:hypothetical protein